MEVAGARAIAARGRVFRVRASPTFVRFIGVHGCAYASEVRQVDREKPTLGG
jgi:hypothetical protein